MRKALILTAGFGEGHNTAARNLKTALETAGGSATILDAFAQAYPRCNALARALYLTLINRLPSLWQAVYTTSDSAPALVPGPFILSKARAAIQSALDSFRPDILLSTYPIYATLLVHRPKTLPLLSVVTDSITVNATWYRAPSDHFITPNDETRDILIRKGVPPDLVRSEGFPVDPRFDSQPTRSDPNPNTPFRVLLVVNSARPDPAETARALLEIPGVHLTIAAGRSETLQASLRDSTRHAHDRTTLLGWTTEMPALMLSHHVLVGKAGGATVQEAIAAKLPMLISRVVPGQEAGNAELILKNGCGAVTESPEAIAAATRGLLADHARLWRQWADAVSRISRPAAAAQIARFALAFPIPSNP